MQADVAALAALGITEVAAVVGGSMGGARALEWVVGYPDRVRAGLLLAVGARATADQIGTQTTQIAAIKADPTGRAATTTRRGGHQTPGCDSPRFAHLTYRGEIELDTRSPTTTRATRIRRPAGATRCKVIWNTKETNCYPVRRRQLRDSHRGAQQPRRRPRPRRGVSAALRACPVPVVVGGITSDRLYPLRLQQELADLLPGCAGCESSSRSTDTTASWWKPRPWAN
ncbi:alpha/beta fold hydrolase [Mycobacterium tuberculosis]|uniref:alpha/beta fold hydrolase n=1 Tax=Mycobacterium tuberculosis TaxID=1773 RepID=UPI0034593056